MANRKDLQIDFLTVSPYVRYIHHMSDACEKNYNIPWRYLYDYELIFVSSGSMTVYTEKDSYTLNAGDIHVMYPLVKHRRKIPAGSVCNHYSVHFDIVYMGEEADFSPEEVYIAYCNTDCDTVSKNDRLATRPLYTLGDIKLPQKQHVSNPAAYIETLEKMCDAFFGKYFAYEIDLKRYMLSLFKFILHDVRAHFFPTHAKTSEDDDISTIIQYLYDNMRNPINFETICRLHGYSMSIFRKLFRQRTGIPPNEFLISIRLDKATELLQNSSYSVSEVAEMVGYPDSHYFSRLYRKKKGGAPRALNKILNESDDTP